MAVGQVLPDVAGGQTPAWTMRQVLIVEDEPWGGNVDEFARIYDETAARVYGVVLRVLRDPAQAEEVTQEVYLDAWRRFDRYDSTRGSVVSWLLTIAHGKAVDRVRSVEASRRRDLTDCEQRGREVSGEDASDNVERLHDAQMVRHALSALSVDQRRAIELAYFGGHTHSEVARLLEIPLGTAKTRIRAGLIQLRCSFLTAVGQPTRTEFGRA